MLKLEEFKIRYKEAIEGLSEKEVVMHYNSYLEDPLQFHIVVDFF